MKILLIFLAIVLLFSSCEDYMNINTTIREIQKLAKKKYQLSSTGSGVAAPGVIKNFSLTFVSNSVIDEESARKLLVDFTEDYIKLINTSPMVKQYFETLPVTEKHAFFIINFKDSKGVDVKNLSAIQLGRGEVAFFITGKDYMFEEISRESYSEAYFKVYGSQPPERK